MGGRIPWTEKGNRRKGGGDHQGHFRKKNKAPPRGGAPAEKKFTSLENQRLICEKGKQSKAKKGGAKVSFYRRIWGKT